MVVNLIFASNIFLGSLLIFIMLFSGRTNIKVNMYLILIISQQISHRAFIFYISYNNLELTLFDNYPAIFTILLVPSIFLYARTLLTKKIDFKIDAIHFILPAVFILISSLFYETSHQQNSFFTFSLVSVYLFLTYTKIKDYNRNSHLKHDIVKQWVYVLFSAITFNYFLGIMLGAYYGLDSREWLVNFYVIGSVVWFLAFCYIFLNPIILYGRIILFKSLVYKESNSSLWKFSPIQQVDEKHLYIQTSLTNKYSDIIYKIIKLQSNDQLIREHSFTIDFLSSKLGIPKSHLNYLFTYHCTYRGNDYINLIKVLKSKRLINSGYLNNKTIEALAVECNFNSRITFFKNFKNYTGFSPSEFNSKNRNQDKLINKRLPIDSKGGYQIDG